MHRVIIIVVVLIATQKQKKGRNTAIASAFLNLFWYHNGRVDWGNY